MTDSIFMKQQTPTDFSGLRNVLNCLPCNLDGITERLGQFLILELKHGEELSVGQNRMLKAFAALDQFSVLIVNCKWSEPNEKGGRLFDPESFRVMDKTGNLGEEYPTNAKDFAVRYEIWVRNPKDGCKPFTCSASEFEATYLRWLPSAQQPEGLSRVKSGRPEQKD